jgi:hypothetical protein
MKKYQKKVRKCETCNCDVKVCGWYNHLKTRKHQNGEKNEAEKKEEEIKKLNEEDTKNQIKQVKELMTKLYEELHKSKTKTKKA